MSTGLAAVYFAVSLIATLYAAAVFAERLDRLGARLGLPEALLGLLTAAGADAPELAAAIAAIVLGSIGMVHAALRLGDAAGLPQVLVGTLLLAVLTSLPNAYTGLRLGRAGRGSALVAETMNSNTINLVGGMAVPALFVVGSDLSGLERTDMVWLLVTTAAAVALLARRRGLGQAGGIALVAGWVAFAAVQGAAGGARGPVPPKLAGVWGATLVNYPAVGLYKGYYRLKFGPGSQMHYLPAHEGPVAQAVSVSGSRITFMRSGVCTTPGTYVWNVTRKTLTFRKVSDACRKRVVQLVRTWTRAR